VEEESHGEPRHCHAGHVTPIDVVASVRTHLFCAYVYYYLQMVKFVQGVCVYMI
jgi:hypothetical protein